MIKLSKRPFQLLGSSQRSCCNREALYNGREAATYKHSQTDEVARPLSAHTGTASQSNVGDQENRADEIEKIDER